MQRNPKNSKRKYQKKSVWVDGSVPLLDLTNSLFENQELKFYKSKSWREEWFLDFLSSVLLIQIQKPKN